MATNLVSLVMQFLTPEMIGRIATALGLDRNLVQSAIGAAVPGLLAGFSGVATRPGGAQKLAEAAKQETGTLGRFADMLGAGGQSTFDTRRQRGVETYHRPHQGEARDAHHLNPRLACVAVIAMEGGFT
jgi:hypothetical protein